MEDVVWETTNSRPKVMLNSRITLTAQALLGWKILIRSDDLQAQEEYRRKQDALRRQSAQGTGESVPLTDLEFYLYLTEDGHITDLTQPGVKASLYAIYDENKNLCYIGVSRQVSRSLLP